ncbi:hypothetical protein [Thermovibrio sp.]
MFFVVLTLFVPFLYYYPTNFNFKGLPLRCFFLNLGASFVFYLIESGKYRSLLLFSIFGLLLSLAYLKLPLFYFIPFCLSFTITSVIMVSFVAYLKLSSV